MNSTAAILELPPDVSVGSLEFALDALAKPSGLEGDLVVDMTACRFVEPASLILLLAVMHAHQRKGHALQIFLPESVQVRDFFRIWRFPEAVRYALGHSFRAIVRAEDHQYFGERSDTIDSMKYAGRVISTDDGRERLLPTDFFGIRTLVPDSSPFAHLVASDECERWNQQHVQSVLRTHFGTHGGRFGSHVVHEAIMNSLRHPGARIIQTASVFERTGPDSERSSGNLTLVVWDDGESMVTTLSHAIERGLEVRSGTFPNLTASYEVVIEDEDGHRRAPIHVTSDQGPNTDTSLDLLLLSCLFPGVTRDVRGVGHRVHKSVTRDDPQLGQPGMGLYILANTVVDVLGGQLALRTGHLFLNLKKGRSGSSYRAKVKRFGAWHPPMSGNMVTVRVPIVHR